eukprot:365463-Chlamydomonas_euryale.AAC.8
MIKDCCANNATAEPAGLPRRTQTKSCKKQTLLHAKQRRGIAYTLPGTQMERLLYWQAGRRTSRNDRCVSRVAVELAETTAA